MAYFQCIFTEWNRALFSGMPAWFSVSTLGTIVLSLLGVWYLLKKVFIDFEYEDEEEGGEE